MQRREFLAATTGATLAAAAPCSPAWAANATIPIIDTHQHLWDLAKFQPPWLASAPKVITSTHATKEYLQATKGLHVAKAVYMEIDVAPKDHAREARHVIELCKSDKHPTAAAVISGRPNEPGFEDYLKPLLKGGYVKGVRQVLHVPATKRGMCLESTFVQSMKMLGKRGLSYDLCMRPMELDDGWKLAGLCPDTRFIVDHCGNADPKAFFKKSEQQEEPWHDIETWKRSMGRLAERPNVICKISGIIARADSERGMTEQLAPIVNFCLEQFGPDRVVFGGDWPVCKLGGSFQQWVNSLREIIAERPEVEQHKLLHRNAERIYKLS